MQLKEFLLISPSVEAKEVFQAIQTVIAPEAISFAASQAGGASTKEKQ